jgi:hypothetical protein
MKDFVTYDIRCNLSKAQVYEKAVGALSEFAWRQGDSDAQGPYISGSNDQRIQVKLWLGEDPLALSVSFRRAWLDAPDRETRKSNLIDRIERTLISSLGTVVKREV